MSGSGRRKWWSMGDKGAKQSTQAAVTAEELVDTLQPLGDVRSKRMFGGFGVFADDVMFGLVDSSGQGFLRVGEDTQARYEAADAHAHGRMPYWSIPPSVHSDEELLIEWAREALGVARAARK